MSEAYTLFPVSASQRGTFNIKELTKNSDRFFTESAKTIFLLEEISEERVVNILKDTFKNNYFAAEEEKKKAKSEKKVQAPSCYILWCNDNRNRIVAENPSADAKRVIELLGESWKTVSDADKKVYIDKANVLKQQVKDGTYVAPVKDSSKAKAGTKRPATEAPAEAAPAPKKKEAPASKKEAAPVAAAPVAAKEPSKKKEAAKK